MLTHFATPSRSNSNVRARHSAQSAICLGTVSAAVTDRYLRRIGAGDAIDFARSRDWAAIQ
jgi:hypothetical protein